ncbi:MAG: Adenylate cyclase [Spartobacteria bacterium]|nr:Adenylate cyclase [Spartobacteria bacterium]
MDLKDLFTELKRRNVYKVAVAYAVVGWLLIQIATQVLPFFEVPNWTVRLVVLLVGIGFVVALVIAWAFELTPEGLRRTEDVDETALRNRRHGSVYGPWVYVVLVGVLFSIGLFLFGRYTAPRALSVAARQPNAPPAPAKSIAVLPFENLSRDPDNAYFAEGIQDEILARLAKISDLKVISRTSTQRYKSSPDDLPEIAKRLGVANILEGSVQKTADRVRVTVQLINAATDAHLWADTYDRNLTDVFAVESEIAKMISDTLQAKLTGSEQHAIASRPTENAEAYQLYLKGRFFWNKRTAQDFSTAIQYFQQAIDKDPGFALAYAGLADTYVLLSGFGAASPKDSLPKAKAAAQKALELDSSLGEAHTALAQALFAYEFNFAEADREFRRAIELNPNYATAHHWYAESGLTPLGRFDEAIVEIKRALELDPLSLIINSDVGTILFAARRYDDSIEQLRKTVQMDPGFYYARWALGEGLEITGRTKEARAEYEKALALNHDDPLPLALLGRVYARTDRKDEALKILKRLQTWPGQGYVSPYNSALVYLGLGQKDEAIRSLEQTYEDRDGYNIAFLKVDAFLDPLRGEPRFEALVRKIFGQPDGAAAARVSPH